MKVAKIIRNIFKKFKRSDWKPFINVDNMFVYVKAEKTILDSIEIFQHLTYDCNKKHTYNIYKLYKKWEFLSNGVEIKFKINNYVNKCKLKIRIRISSRKIYVIMDNECYISESEYSKIAELIENKLKEKIKIICE